MCVDVRFVCACCCVPCFCLIDLSLPLSLGLDCSGIHHSFLQFRPRSCATAAIGPIENSTYDSSDTWGVWCDDITLMS